MGAEGVNVLDLFSGIGGFSLGLERAGMKTVAFCEIEPYCRAVLKKHWPDVPCYDDVRKLTAEQLAADGISVDVICGGFPCQDISVAGAGAGLAGEHSGLWSEYARLIRELRPRYVIVENVSALLHRGLDRVLGDMAALGLDAEWHCIPASAVGAPHRRDRVWIVAHSDSTWRMWEQRYRATDQRQETDTFIRSGTDVEIAVRDGLQGPVRSELSRFQGGECQQTGGPGQWPPEPDVGRMAHGVPARVDRLRALGNSVVPQITEMIGRAIMRPAA
jgi:DNA (cytosine-5)-methyltransferase 1